MPFTTPKVSGLIPPSLSLQDGGGVNEGVTVRDGIGVIEEESGVALGRSVGTGTLVGLGGK